jgi:hypothetical protein
MPIIYEKLLALKIPEVAQTYTEKDAILYALGVGLGHDPTNTDELPFVYEKISKCCRRSRWCSAGPASGRAISIPVSIG